MGTHCRIVLYAPSEGGARKAATAAFARIAELDRMMTDYDPHSELMSLCQKSGGPPVLVSEDLFLVLARAQEVSRRSEGAFDVTVGPVVHLWRRARRTGLMPDPAQLTEARALVGYQLVRLDDPRRTVQLLKAGMRLDLGGIAKGYAADEALKILKRHGVTQALVALGGDIALGDSPPNANGWEIGVARLGDQEGKPRPHLLLHNAAVSTSGDTEQYVEIEGRRYSHLIDPRTGMALSARCSATVVAAHGITADSLTKVASILEPKRGLQIVEGFSGASALVVRQGSRGLETFVSKNFPRVGPAGVSPNTIENTTPAAGKP
jgi:thiamine biosynthesis lipoprotein